MTPPAETDPFARAEAAIRELQRALATRPPGELPDQDDTSEAAAVDPAVPPEATQTTAGVRAMPPEAEPAAAPAEGSAGGAAPGVWRRVWRGLRRRSHA